MPPTRPWPGAGHLPMRIVIYKPCCIGDVILTTPLLAALRRAYPRATVHWIIGPWSAGAVKNHPALDSTLDAGQEVNPAASLRGFMRLYKLFRAGRYDLAVVPVRSVWAGLPPLLAGIPRRAGLDSGGRGLAHNIRVRVSLSEARHEAEIYLDIARALGIETDGLWASFHPTDAAVERVDELLRRLGIGPNEPLVALHPGGGRNPGMVMAEKRWPIRNFAELGARCAERWGAILLVLGGPGDLDLAQGVLDELPVRALNLAGELSLDEIGALGRRVMLYVGNDTGVTHLAAAAGARTIMIFGPSDPRRYAPYVPPEQARAVYKPFPWPEGGVGAGRVPDFDWGRHGVGVAEVWEQAVDLVEGSL